MKKVLVLLVALSMMAGAVFAQATIGGYVRGIGTIDEDGITSFSSRIRLNFSAKSEDGTAMFGMRLQGSGLGNTISLDDNTFAEDDSGTDPDAFTYFNLDVNYFYGRLMLADSKVQIDAGRLWVTDYDICSGISDYYLGNVENYVSSFVFFWENGLALQVLPIDGLRAGVVFIPNESIGLEDFGAGAMYSIEGIGDAIVTARFAEEFKDSELNASFSYTGVENLSASVGYKGLVNHTLYGIVNYGMDALTVNVAPMYDFTAETFYGEASIQYVLSDAFDVIGLFAYDQSSAILDAKYMAGFEGRVKTGGSYFWIAPYYLGDVGFKLDLGVRVNF